MTETWLPIENYLGLYEVSNKGGVRSVREGRARPMAWVLDSSGYPTVKLSKDGVPTRHKVHRLVCRAFNGPPPRDGMDCAHLDGSRTNPAAGNLVWVTRAVNMSHKAIHGTQQRGERGPGAKLKRQQVEEIRSKKATHGLGSRVLSREYGISESQIKRILNGTHWLNN